MSATLESVAQRANVSVSTASRILSNGSKYSFKPETRERVLTACHELGYKPNLPARALASGKTQIIGFAVPRTQDGPFSGLGSLQILTSLEAACSQLGYHVLISSPRQSHGKVDASFKNLIQSGYLDGIVVDGHFEIAPLMDVIRASDLPCVVVGYQPHDHFIRTDNFEGCKLLVRHLYELGHRNIGILGIEGSLVSAGGQRLAGIYEAAGELGVDIGSMPRYDGPLSKDGAAQAAQRLFRNHSDLTAIVALNDLMALGAMRGLLELGVRIPDDISLVGFDNLPQSADIVPGLTTIDQNLSSWGELLIDMLIDLLDGDTPESVIIPPRLIHRGSSGTPRQGHLAAASKNRK